MELKTDGVTGANEGGRARRRPGRGGAISLALCGVALLVVSVLGTGTAGAQEGDDGVTSTSASTTSSSTTVASSSSSIITIDQTPIEVDGACNPLAQAQLTYVTKSTDESYQMIVTSATTPCTPIAAAAVAYKMPAGASPAGGQWPQQLLERQDFTIDKASVTTITFAKDCTAMQFDVITGESPDTISPTGPWHGPLLFPGDVATSQQYFPMSPECNTSTTTTPTTTAPQVAGETTIAPATVSNVSPNAAVAGETATNPSNEAALALTGRNSGPLALAGGLLLLAGVAMFAWSRRNREQ